MSLLAWGKVGAIKCCWCTPFLLQMWSYKKKPPWFWSIFNQHNLVSLHMENVILFKIIIIGSDWVIILGLTCHVNPHMPCIYVFLEVQNCSATQDLRGKRRRFLDLTERWLMMSCSQLTGKACKTKTHLYGNITPSKWSIIWFEAI